ncbi:MAG: hypothetical protein ACOCOU_07980, partial [Prevotella sp.]
TLDFILRFLAMAEIKQACLCSFGLTKTLDFILRFLAMAEIKQACLCSFGLTKTLRLSVSYYHPRCGSRSHTLCIMKDFSIQQGARIEKMRAP